MTGEIGFQRIYCICEHPDSAHDDGFGCTEPECECLAQWDWVDYGL